MNVTSWRARAILGAVLAVSLSACQGTVPEQAARLDQPAVGRAPEEAAATSSASSIFLDADFVDLLVLAPASPPPPTPYVFLDADLLDQLVLAPPAPLPPAPPIDDNPHQVMGLVPDQVADLLGSPGFVRRESSAEIWQYREPDCVLDLFLYVDALKARRVVHYELRGTTAGMSLDIATSRDCFSQILSRNSAV